jgi:hypothetical protein
MMSKCGEQRRRSLWLDDRSEMPALLRLRVDRSSLSLVRRETLFLPLVASGMDTILSEMRHDHTTGQPQ